ncbi:MAG: 30S ribosomal protein S5 [Candidatus Marinimicrobia bacterium]|nr:30S ribosomal protein S5 [Candidatus Neomarinimicrobiota bacterium]MBL7023066.1 30S ribosomal protein S5 [Candidatus Neomarinimicrobiota bacterium]MBL7109086.1 30S ribosomal protein S5 [Candidatus Neomarinimicrobiota bacterium]
MPLAKLDLNFNGDIDLNIINPSELELNEETVVKINRVTKVITGGRRFRFNSIVAVGDSKGHLGIGFGKANEVISAVNKAKDNAKKNIFKVRLINGTIPHTITVKYGAAKVILKPASPGTGIIAGGPVRALMEQVGVTDILSKVTGSSNAVNVVRAVEKGLRELRDPLTVSRQRGITIRELFS